MLKFIPFLKLLLFKPFCSQSALIAENMALRHQVSVLKRSVKKPKIRKRDRFFWILLSKLWSNWKKSLFIVQPETVLKWHRQSFKLYWKVKSKYKMGRPAIDYKIIALIHRMSKENSTWGAPHIYSELLLLGYNVAESTIAKYMLKEGKPPSQSWKLS